LAPRQFDRDAGGDDAGKCAVCYLQIRPPMSFHHRACAHARDMDAWGYTFRLGSSRAWFERDATDACAWLRESGLIDDGIKPTFRLRA
jgi:hypothetical protein